MVALSAMAAQSVFGGGFRLTRELGTWREVVPGARAKASYHPSAILRMRNPERHEARARLVRDLAAAWSLVARR